MSARYAVLETLDRKSCTTCGAVLEPGPLGARLEPGEPLQLLCARCLIAASKRMGLILQVLSLQRQAVAHFLAKADRPTRAKLGEHLLQFAVGCERSAFGAWPRQHPTAKIDCEHCLAEHYRQFESERLRHIVAAQGAVRRTRILYGSDTVEQHLAKILAEDFAGLDVEEAVTAVDLYARFAAQVSDRELCPKTDEALHLCGKTFPIDLLDGHAAIRWFSETVWKET